MAKLFQKRHYEFLARFLAEQIAAINYEENPNDYWTVIGLQEKLIKELQEENSKFKPELFQKRVKEIVGKLRPPKKFNDLIFESHPSGRGIQAVMFFQNGYGVSVVKGQFTYGGDKGLYEVAVIRNLGGKKFTLCYDTPITGDVIGYCNEEKVSKIMQQVQELEGE